MKNLMLNEVEAFTQEHFYTDYAPLPWRDETLRHIGEHITKAARKVVDFIEHPVEFEQEQKVIKEAMPDTALYRSQIINLLEINPAEIPWLPDTGSLRFKAFSYVVQDLSWAAGAINGFIEPLEHDTKPAQLNNEVMHVPARLHRAASHLADLFNQNLELALLERITQ